MAGVRVNTGAKRIEVNDDGDYIILNFGDNSFPDRFFSMIDRVQQHGDECRKKLEEIGSEHKEGSEDYVRASAALLRGVHEDIRDEVDGFFGPGTCRKVFGDILPGVELYDEFFTQLMPYFEEAGRERAQRMKKYSAARTGNA